MRLSACFPILATPAVATSVLGNQGSITARGNAEERLLTTGNDQSLEINNVHEEPLKLVKEGSAVAKGLCLYSVEELRIGPVIYFSPYSLDELITAKERLEKEGYCQTLQSKDHPSSPPARMNHLNTRSKAALEADKNGPRCVHAILPSPGNNELSPEGPDKSSATFQRISIFSFVVAFTALLAL
ncbi:hypothetical protein F5B19DRAFT_488997 [Rostrohypoxylon terebratum]|nr:hypothetical protein F5B19DRAFT_488997 [Rostrohypoxylon terebratum]